MSTRQQPTAQSRLPRLRRLRLAAALTALCAMTAALVAVPAGAASAHPHPDARPYCDIYWGSLRKGGSTEIVAPPHLGGVIGVRAGRHPCFDRFVLDLDSPGTPWGVSYVDEVPTPDPHDDRTLDPRGGAQLMISLSHTESADRTFPYTPRNPAELVKVDGWRTFRQISYAGEFEQYYIFALGVRARLPFRTFWLDGPGEQERLVVDVAHRW